MRHNQKLNYEGLREEAARAVNESGQTQTTIASEMGVSQGLISRALRETGPGLAKAQRDMIAHLTEYVAEEEVEVCFRIKRKGL